MYRTQCIIYFTFNMFMFARLLFSHYVVRLAYFLFFFFYEKRIVDAKWTCAAAGPPKLNITDKVKFSIAYANFVFIYLYFFAILFFHSSSFNFFSLFTSGFDFVLIFEAQRIYAKIL